MPRYVINGLFLNQQMTGIQRCAYELCRELDQLAADKHIVVLVPGACKMKEHAFRNLKVIPYGRHTGILWEQTDLRRFIKKYNMQCISFCNVTPLFVTPGITAVHDLMFKLFPSYFTTFRNKLSRHWHTFQAGYALKHEKWILCTSSFTKGVLEREYPCAEGKVVVVPPGWQHILRFEENAKWQEAYPFLQPKSFYFSMATRSKNKNGQWIFDAARNNPGQIFAVAGRSYEMEGTDKPPNLYLLGYIPDADACALMKNCRAFIFPSHYEGFGIPPLEALALGADIIVSDVSALPEVFGDSAHYIDPNDADVDIEALLEEKTAPAGRVLNKYSWEKSARILYKVMYSKRMDERKQQMPGQGADGNVKHIRDRL